MIIFRMFVLFFNVAENIRKMRFENREGERIKVWVSNKTEETKHSWGEMKKRGSSKCITCPVMLSVGRPAYIYILKGATTGLICSALLCRIATVQIILTSSRLQMCYHDCLWPKTGGKKPKHYHLQLEKEGWMQGEWKTGGICNHRAKI